MKLATLFAVIAGLGFALAIYALWRYQRDLPLEEPPEALPHHDPYPAWYPDSWKSGWS